MHRSLWLLIGLQLRSWFRAMGRSLQSVRGVLLAILGLGLFGMWLTAIVFQRRSGIPADVLLSRGPAFLLGYCVLNVLLSTGERAVYFSPAEVNFLFSAPFSRRQLLGYKIVLTLMNTLPSTLFLTALFRIHSPRLSSAFVGVVLMTSFMQLFGIALNLASEAIGARVYSRLRKVMLAALILAGLLVFRVAREQGVEGILDSAEWRILSTPLRWFFEAFVANSWLALLEFGVLGVLVNLVLLGVIFSLDANSLEAAAAYSSRVYARIQRLRGGPPAAGSDDGPTPPPTTRRMVPMPPFLGGIGPLVWRQLTTAVRSPSRLVGLLIVLVAVNTTMLSGMHSTRGAAGAELEDGTIILSVSLLALGVVLLSPMMTQLLPMDFRGDLDRLEALKTLPLAPWRLALGQILVPTLVLTACQWLVLAGLAAFEYLRGNNAALLVLAGAAVVLPFNFLLIGLENVLFLLYPTRQMANTPGDFQAMGRNMLQMIAKMLTLGLAIAAAGVAGGLVYFLSGKSDLLAVLAAWIVLAFGGAALVPVAGWAFNRVDVWRDKPG